VGLERAAYNTAVWAPDCGLENAPLRIRSLAERWQAGHARAMARKTAPRIAAVASVVEATPVASVRGPNGPLRADDQARLVALLGARRAAHDRARQHFAMAVRGTGPRGSSAVIGHAAIGPHTSIHQLFGGRSS
jgi:hypothetical protein